MSVRVRFAPSPTGPVHIGNMRVAIFNWLHARHEGGTFLLRVEDTDRERSTPEAVQALLDAMSWLGLDYDEEAMYQSTRTKAHVAAAEELIRAGAAYREEAGERAGCIMFRMPSSDVSFRDEIKGVLTKRTDDLKDFVIVRSDGTPVFHLANVVDDIAMKITLIMRGDDHIENTYRHMAMFQAFGVEPPKYVHLPMIVNQQGKPYSKRDGDAFVGDFREKGFLPQALFNYLSLLGWSPGNDLEKMSREEAVRLFTIDRIKSSAAQMDMKKLTHLNGQYMAELPREDFVKGARLAASAHDWGKDLEDGFFRQVCELMQTRTKLYPQVGEWRYFFSDLFDVDEKAATKILKKIDESATFSSLERNLSAIDFRPEEIEKALRRTESELGMPEGQLNQPARIAVTGLATGAGVYETMALLGKERVMARLRRQMERVSKESQKQG